MTKDQILSKIEDVKTTILTIQNEIPSYNMKQVLVAEEMLNLADQQLKLLTQMANDFISS